MTHDTRHTTHLTTARPALGVLHPHLAFIVLSSGYLPSCCVVGLPALLLRCCTHFIPQRCLLSQLVHSRKSRIGPIRGPVLLFPLLAAGDLFCTYQELKSVRLRSLNR